MYIYILLNPIIKQMVTIIVPRLFLVKMEMIQKETGYIGMNLMTKIVK